MGQPSETDSAPFLGACIDLRRGLPCEAAAFFAEQGVTATRAPSCSIVQAGGGLLLNHFGCNVVTAYGEEAGPGASSVQVGGAEGLRSGPWSPSLVLTPPKQGFLGGGEAASAESHHDAGAAHGAGAG